MNLSKLPLDRLWNTTLNAIDKVGGRSRVLARPMNIHFEINDICNLKCPHCPRENPTAIKDTGHIPFDQIEKLAPWFRRANYVGFVGNGEPFLHPKIMEILQLVIDCGSVPSVISNATLWKRLKLIDKLAGIGPMLLNVSIDGGTRETFEKWRVRAKFDEVRENLAELRRAKERAGSAYPVVNFMVCLMKDNIDELELIADWAGEVGVACITVQNMYPYNDKLEAERVKDIVRCREAIAKMRARAEQHGIRIDWLPMSFDITERGEDGGGYGDLTAKDASERVAQGEKDALVANGNGSHSYHCDYLWNRVHIWTNGDIRYCCFWTGDSIGNIAKDDLGEVWNSPGWQGLRRDLAEGRKPGPCNNCHMLVEHDAKKMVRASWREIKDLSKPR